MAIYQGNKKLAYSCNVDNSVYAVPIGTILSYSATTPPVGFLVCDGSEVSKTTYSDLYSVIGDLYGKCTDTSKFKLPNAKGRVLQGADGNLGTYIAESLPNITGKFYHDPNVTKTLAGAFSYIRGTNINLSNDTANSTSGYVEFDASKSNPIYSGEHVQQNGIAVTFIIKALKVSDKYAEEVGALIDDSSTATDKVWSSEKINAMLQKYSETSNGANVLYKALRSWGIDINKKNVIRVTAVDSNGNYNICIATYQHDVFCTCKTVSFDTIEIKAYNSVGTIDYVLKGTETSIQQLPITCEYLGTV